MREQVEKSRNILFFQCFGAGGSTSRHPKAAGAEPSGEMRDEKLHAILARSRFRSQNAKSTSVSRVGSLLEVEMFEKCMGLWPEAPFEVKMVKAHHSILGALWKLRCSKSAWGCGPKHRSKSKW